MCREAFREIFGKIVKYSFRGMQFCFIGDDGRYGGGKVTILVGEIAWFFIVKEALLCASSSSSSLFYIAFT